MAEFHDDDPQFEEKSKSQIRRELHAPQDPSERLTTLRPQLLKCLSLTDPLRKASPEAPEHKAHIARKRYIQCISRLVRDWDVGAIVALIDQVGSSTRQYNEHFHVLERWCDQLIAGGDAAFDVLVGEFPEHDCQHLRDLVRHTQHEAAHNKPPAVVRKVSKYIRELGETKRSLR